jgi:hypothetical protein
MKFIHYGIRFLLDEEYLSTIFLLRRDFVGKDIAEGYDVVRGSHQFPSQLAYVYDIPLCRDERTFDFLGFYSLVNCGVHLY